MDALRPAGLTIQLGHGTSNVEPYAFSTLTIADKRSGLTIAEVRLSPEQVYDLLISRNKYYPDGIPGKVITARDAHFVGKRRYTFSRLFQLDHDVKGFPSNDPEWSPHVAAWTRQVCSQLWCQDHSWRRQNNGIKIIFWRFEDDLPEENQQEIKALLQGFPAPKGLK